MTMGQGSSRDNARHFAEVFTPPATVFEMLLLPDIRDVLEDIDQPICDPCCGQGQFPAAALALKMFYNLERLDGKAALRALYSLYGVDIQQESVNECREHMFATLCDALEFLTGKKLTAEEIMYGWAIIERHFIQGDSLNDWAECLDRLGAHEEAARVRSQTPEKKPKRKRKERQLSLF